MYHNTAGLDVGDVPFAHVQAFINNGFGGTNPCAISTTLAT